tara:strand:+ start:10755 stop:10994 length:240 start_codon:yes stop_codon:yes gene_type:complete
MGNKFFVSYIGYNENFNKLMKKLCEDYNGEMFSDKKGHMSELSFYFDSEGIAKNFKNEIRIASKRFDISDFTFQEIYDI